MTLWEEKAHAIIRALCQEEYVRMNPQPGKRHVPYNVPALAQQLVDILALKDRKEAEERAKALFLMYDNPTADMKW